MARVGNNWNIGFRGFFPAPNSVDAHCLQPLSPSPPLRQEPLRALVSRRESTDPRSMATVLSGFPASVPLPLSPLPTPRAPRLSSSLPPPVHALDPLRLAVRPSTADRPKPPAYAPKSPLLKDPTTVALGAPCRTARVVPDWVTGGRATEKGDLAFFGTPVADVEEAADYASRVEGDDEVTAVVQPGPTSDSRDDLVPLSILLPPSFQPRTGHTSPPRPMRALSFTLPLSKAEVDPARMAHSIPLPQSPASAPSPPSPVHPSFTITHPSTRSVFPPYRPRDSISLISFDSLEPSHLFSSQGDQSIDSSDSSFAIEDEGKPVASDFVGSLPTTYATSLDEAPTESSEGYSRSLSAFSLVSYQDEYLGEARMKELRYSSDGDDSPFPWDLPIRSVPVPTPTVLEVIPAPSPPSPPPIASTSVLPPAARTPTLRKSMSHQPLRAQVSSWWSQTSSTLARSRSLVSLTSFPRRASTSKVTTVGDDASKVVPPPALRTSSRPRTMTQNLGRSLSSPSLSSLYRPNEAVPPVPALPASLPSDLPPPPRPFTDEEMRNPNDTEQFKLHLRRARVAPSHSTRSYSPWMAGSFDLGHSGSPFEQGEFDLMTTGYEGSPYDSILAQPGSRKAWRGRSTTNSSHHSIGEGTRESELYLVPFHSLSSPSLPVPAPAPELRTSASRKSLIGRMVVKEKVDQEATERTEEIKKGSMGKRLRALWMGFAGKTVPVVPV